MRERWKNKIAKWKSKSNWKDQLYFSFIFFLSFLMFLSTVIVGIVQKNWTYFYTVFLTTPIFLFGKWLSVLETRHLLKGTERSKRRSTILKASLVYIGINIIYLLPFFIVWLTTVLNPNHSERIQHISPCFNWWILLGWLVFLIMFSGFYTVVTNFAWKEQWKWWKEEKQKNQKTQKTQI